MLERILDFATRQRFLMVLLGVAIAALGLWSFTRLPIDAVPDITNNQVVVNTAAPALSPQEVDKQISVPIPPHWSGASAIAVVMGTVQVAFLVIYMRAVRRLGGRR